MSNGDPSITIWSRLEPRARADDMARSLQAQIRDPLWMLARQWQVGEFLGSDGGSPLQATIATETQPLTSYRPGPPRGPAAARDRRDAAAGDAVERPEVELGAARAGAARVGGSRRSYATLGHGGGHRRVPGRAIRWTRLPAARPAVPDPDGKAWRALARGA